MEHSCVVKQGHRFTEEQREVRQEWQEWQATGNTGQYNLKPEQNIPLSDSGCIFYCHFLHFCIQTTGCTNTEGPSLNISTFLFCLMKNRLWIKKRKKKHYTVCASCVILVIMYNVFHFHSPSVVTHSLLAHPAMETKQLGSILPVCPLLSLLWFMHVTGAHTNINTLRTCCSHYYHKVKAEVLPKKTFAPLLLHQWVRGRQNK